MKTAPILQHHLRHEQPELLYPLFGRANAESGKALVRTDLPRCARLFVAVHELYHLTDTADNRLWREIKANAYPFWAIPAGFVWIVFSTIFSKDRLAYYCSLTKNLAKSEK